MRATSSGNRFASVGIDSANGLLFTGDTLFPGGPGNTLFEGASFALAQNGDLYDFARMRYDLLEHINPALTRLIEGTTDTEWVYALVLSQLTDPFGLVDPDEAASAVVQAQPANGGTRSRWYPRSARWPRPRAAAPGTGRRRSAR